MVRLSNNDDGAMIMMINGNRVPNDLCDSSTMSDHRDINVRSDVGLLNSRETIAPSSGSAINPRIPLQSKVASLMAKSHKNVYETIKKENEVKVSSAKTNRIDTYPPSPGISEPNITEMLRVFKTSDDGHKTYERIGIENRVPQRPIEKWWDGAQVVMMSTDDSGKNYYPGAVPHRVGENRFPMSMTLAELDDFVKLIYPNESIMSPEGTPEDGVIGLLIPGFAKFAKMSNKVVELKSPQGMAYSLAKRTKAILQKLAETTNSLKSKVEELKRVEGSPNFSKIDADAKKSWLSRRDKVVRDHTSASKASAKFLEAKTNIEIELDDGKMREFIDQSYARIVVGNDKPYENMKVGTRVAPVKSFRHGMLTTFEGDTGRQYRWTENNLDNPEVTILDLGGSRSNSETPEERLVRMEEYSPVRKIYREHAVLQEKLNERDLLQ